MRGLVGILLVIIAEEGFFPARLWPSLKRVNQTERQVLMLTSVAFGKCYICTISLGTDFIFLLRRIPIYLINRLIINPILEIIVK
jgi:hypothetical protein